jgi:histidinol-phosphate aminotransferase
VNARARRSRSGRASRRAARRAAKGSAALKLRFRASVKRIRDYEAPEEGREGKLRLDFNENTVGCSPAVLRALQTITAEQLAMYPEYEKSIRRLAAYFGVRPSEMLLTNGVDDALRLLMEVFIEPGDAVLVPEPTFSMYRFFSQVAGARVISVRYDEAINFPLASTLRELRRAPHILFIANPNNPTGTLLDEASLARILDAAPRTVVLVDEAYFDFSGLTVLPWIRRRPNLIVSRTFSKAAGLAALRLGALFAREDVISAMRRAFTPYPVNSLALIAAEAAVNDEKFQRAYAEEVRESRSQLARGLEQLGARVFPSAANFVLADFGPGGTRLVKRLARRKILVRDRASEFGRDGFMRITAGTIPQTQRLLKAIKEEW